MSASLEGQVALVTGGSRGIGRAIALGMAEAGADLVVNYRVDADAASAVVAKVRALGRRAIAVRADVGMLDQIEALISETLKEMRDLRILVNNAGHDAYIPALEISEELWDRTMDVHLKGMFFCARAAARAMRSAGHGGSIINISSVQAMHVVPPHADYCTAKGGITMMTKALAAEWGPLDIRVNALAPGAIRTDLTADRLARPERLKELLSHTPLGRVGEPEDCAPLAVFLAGSGARFITGQTIFVDGGLLLV